MTVARPKKVGLVQTIADFVGPLPFFGYWYPSPHCGRRKCVDVGRICSALGIHVRPRWRQLVCAPSRAVCSINLSRFFSQSCFDKINIRLSKMGGGQQVSTIQEFNLFSANVEEITSRISNISSGGGEVSPVQTTSVIVDVAIPVHVETR